MVDKKTAKALVTGVLNGDDAEVSRIVDALLEMEFNAQLGPATKAVMESIASGKRPVFG
jgi:hypothetical protein